MMIRLGFVSNSSSSSFVVPKKYLTKDDYDTYEQMVFDSRYDEELHESENYVYGRFSNHNGILTRMFKKYENMDGVDYYES
jgi:hypothetical protein